VYGSYIGSVRLQDLSAIDLDRWYADLLNHGKRNGEGLAPKTVRNVAIMVRAALKSARRKGIITHNVSEDSDIPARTRPVMKTWTVEESAYFLDAMSDDRLFAVVLFAATTGVRRITVLLALIFGVSGRRKFKRGEADRARQVRRVGVAVRFGLSRYLSPSFSGEKMQKSSSPPWKWCWTSWLNSESPPGSRPPARYGWMTRPLDTLDAPQEGALPMALFSKKLPLRRPGVVGQPIDRSEHDAHVGSSTRRAVASLLGPLGGGVPGPDGAHTQFYDGPHPPRGFPAEPEWDPLRR